MLRLTANLPDVVTSALVVPAPVATLDPAEARRAGGGLAMRRDDEVERIAMEVVMRFERSRGWKPEDVSNDREHYDIRSRRAPTVTSDSSRSRAEPRPAAS